MKRFLFPAFIALAYVFVLTATPALADDGPDISMLGALEAVPESVISMDHELVEFTVPENSGGSIPGKATFWFVNPTAQDVTVPSVFPLTFEGPGSWNGSSVVYAQNVKAKVDGLAVKGEVKMAAYPYGNDETGELSAKKAEGYAFTFKVPAKKTVKVEVSFDTPLNRVAYGGFNYYIGSGAGWAGPIKEAKFTVHYPYPLEKGWIETGIWNDLDDRMVTGTESLVGKDFTTVYTNIEPTESRSYLSFEFLPSAEAKRLISAKKGMETFKTARQWRDLADVYRSLEFENGQFDAHRPQFAVEGYWMAIDKYLAAEKIEPFKPVDYRQAEMLAALYSDNWAPNAMGDPNAPQFSDLERYRRLMEYLQSQKNEWWGFERYRMENILALDKWWRGTKSTSEKMIQPTIASSTYELGKTATAQASVEQLDLLQREAQSLRNEVKNLQQNVKTAGSSGRTIDPIVALLLVFGGVAAGFMTVALAKRALAKKQ